MSLFALCFMAFAQAQDLASLKGGVTDGAREPVEDATITIIACGGAGQTMDMSRPLRRQLRRQMRE